MGPIIVLNRDDQLLIRKPKGRGTYLAVQDPFGASYHVVFPEVPSRYPPGLVRSKVFRAMDSLTVRLDTLRGVHATLEPIFRHEGTYTVAVGTGFETDAPSIDVLVSVYYCPEDSQLDSAAVRPLTYEDFIFNQLPILRAFLSVDSSDVTRLLGVPRSTRGSPTTALLYWEYGDWEIELYDGRVYAVTLTGPAVATVRGLRVGDSAERVAALYGPPVSEAVDSVVYVRRSDYGNAALVVYGRGGQVGRIRLGGLRAPEP